MPSGCLPRPKSTTRWLVSACGALCCPSPPRKVTCSLSWIVLSEPDMWLILTALRRPVTIVVAVAALAMCSLLAIRRMPIDIFPDLGAPQIFVAQPYGGMDPSQMEGFLTYYYEYHFLYITGIEHVESKSIQGVALMKLVFHPDTDMSQAMSETVGYVNRARAFMPTGTVPPFVMRFDAGSVPVGQLIFSSPIRNPGEMQN